VLGEHVQHARLGCVRWHKRLLREVRRQCARRQVVDRAFDSARAIVRARTRTERRGLEHGRERGLLRLEDVTRDVGDLGIDDVLVAVGGGSLRRMSDLDVDRDQGGRWTLVLRTRVVTRLLVALALRRKRDARWLATCFSASVYRKPLARDSRGAL